MIRYYPDLIQGSDEWLAARRGLLTASEMNSLLTPTLKQAKNDKRRQHFYELLAQRITGYVEPHYISDDMLRGQNDELEARRLYAERYSPIQEMGFITNDKWGVTIGYSPDGLVDDDGLIECKSRRQKYQLETIMTDFLTDDPPDEYMLQLQTGLLVTERKWLDFVSYSGGLPMVTIRVYPDDQMQDYIVEAARNFENDIQADLERYQRILASSRRMIPTERRVIQEMYL